MIRKQNTPVFAQLCRTDHIVMFLIKFKETHMLKTGLRKEYFSLSVCKTATLRFTVRDGWKVNFSRRSYPGESGNMGRHKQYNQKKAFQWWSSIPDPSKRAWGGYDTGNNTVYICIMAYLNGTINGAKNILPFVGSTYMGWNNWRGSLRTSKEGFPMANICQMDRQEWK